MLYAFQFFQKKRGAAKKGLFFFSWPLLKCDIYVYSNFIFTQVSSEDYHFYLGFSLGLVIMKHMQCVLAEDSHTGCSHGMVHYRAPPDHCTLSLWSTVEHTGVIVQWNADIRQGANSQGKYYETRKTTEYGMHEWQQNLHNYL